MPPEHIFKKVITSEKDFITISSTHIGNQQLYFLQEEKKKKKFLLLEKWKKKYEKRKHFVLLRTFCVCLY